MIRVSAHWPAVLRLIGLGVVGLADTATGGSPAHPQRPIRVSLIKPDEHRLLLVEMTSSALPKTPSVFLSMEYLWAGLPHSHFCIV